MWDVYFADFVLHKLNLAGPGQYIDSQENDIAQQFWKEVFKLMPQRLVDLHCYASQTHLSLAQTAAILHPMASVQKVRKWLIIVFPQSAGTCATNRGRQLFEGGFNFNREV